MPASFPCVLLVSWMLPPCILHSVALGWYGWELLPGGGGKLGASYAASGAQAHGWPFVGNRSHWPWPRPTAPPPQKKKQKQKTKTPRLDNLKHVMLPITANRELAQGVSGWATIHHPGQLPLDRWLCTLVHGGLLARGSVAGQYIHCQGQLPFDRWLLHWCTMDCPSPPGPPGWRPVHVLGCSPVATPRSALFSGSLFGVTDGGARPSWFAPAPCLCPGLFPAVCGFRCVPSR